jgi:hypothetical protein
MESLGFNGIAGICTVRSIKKHKAIWSSEILIKECGKNSVGCPCLATDELFDFESVIQYLWALVYSFMKDGVES